MESLTLPTKEDERPSSANSFSSRVISDINIMQTETKTKKLGMTMDYQ